MNAIRVSDFIIEQEGNKLCYLTDESDPVMSNDYDAVVDVFALEIIKMRKLLQAVHDAVSINSMGMFPDEIIALQDVEKYINSLPR